MTKAERQELADLRARVAALEGAAEDSVDLDGLREELAALGWLLQPSRAGLYVATRALPGRTPRQFSANEPAWLLARIKDYEVRVEATGADRPVEIISGAVAASHEAIPRRGAR